MKKITNCLLTLAQCAFAVAQASANAPAHTHGDGHITLIYQDQALLIELSSPAVNFLGFEHRPSNAREREDLKRLTHTLETPDELVGLKPACTLQSAKADMPFRPQASNERHPHKSEHEHEHERANGKGETHIEQITHHDIVTRYTWRCSTRTAPALTFHYFERFAHFNTLEVKWIVNGQQGATELSKARNILEPGVPWR